MQEELAFLKSKSFIFSHFSKVYHITLLRSMLVLLYSGKSQTNFVDLSWDTSLFSYLFYESKMQRK